jgi:hypothetical protein
MKTLCYLIFLEKYQLAILFYGMPIYCHFQAEIPNCPACLLPILPHQEKMLPIVVLKLTRIVKMMFHEMSLYMETLDDLYLGGDDLSCDFQVDSGTLACVACGILGFPFMCVIQPSEKASMELLPADHLLVQEGPRVSRPENTRSSPELDGSVKSSISGICSAYFLAW